jgi:hypothetical protein
MKYLQRSITGIVVLLVAVALGGCGKSAQVEATGKGTIRGINTIVTSPELIFLIEERPVGNVSFRQAIGFVEYDDLTYNFSFDLLLPGESDATRLASQFLDVVAETEYTVVLGGTIAAPTIMFWEEPDRVWADTDTAFEADFAHLSPVLGEVDVYFLPVGTVPVLGNAVTTLNYGERIPYQEFADGSYEFFITLKDDPANYLYQSQALSSQPASRITLAIFDADPSTTAGIAVNLINAGGGSANLPDANQRASFRLLHAAFGTGNVDGYLNSDLSTIIFPNVGFGEISASSDIESITMPFTVTDAGNSGAPVLEDDLLIGGNSKHTIFLHGEPGGLLYFDLRDDARPLETFPVVRVSNVSVNAGVIDIYMLPPGTVIEEDTLAEFSGLPRVSSTGFMGPDAGMLEITITQFGEITPISVPVTIDIANGDIVDIAILATADPAMAEVFIFDSTLP